MAININLKIQKKDLWLLAAIMIFLVGVAYVIAYGSGSPQIHGHDIGEIGGAALSSSGYSITCVGGISGSQWPFCCRINITSGLTECRQTSAWPLLSWVAVASPFSAGTTGLYSLSCSYGTPGFSYPICCRINSSGTSKCKVATNWNLGGWSDATADDPF